MTDGPEGPRSRTPSTPPPDDPGGGVPLLGASWPFLVLGLALVGVGLSSWRAVPAGVWHDDGVYMMVGEALARGQGLTYAGVVDGPAAVKFPPAYSALLAVLWWLLPGVGPVTLAATLLNLAFLAGAGVAFAWVLHRQAGLPRGVAVLGAGAAFASADVIRVALVPLSEPLFMALAAGALLFVPGAEKGRVRDRVILAAVLTVAVLTRSAGVAVVAGVAAALALRGAWASAVVAAAPPTAAFLAWGAWAGARADELPEGMRDVLGPYGGWLSEQILGAPLTFLAALPGHALTVGWRTVAVLVPGGTGWVVWAMALPLLAVAAAGLVRLGRTAPAVPLVALVYLLMLLVWPFADRRLVTPLHPFLVAGVTVGAWTVARWSGPRRVRAVMLAFLVAWGGTYAMVSASRVANAWAASPYRLRAERLAAAVEALDRVAGPDAVVGAPEFWPALHLHGGWTTTPSALFRPRTEDPDEPVWGSPDAQLRLWWSAGVTHLLLEQGGQIHGDALNRLEEACPGRVTIPARLPPQMVVALTWDRACARSLGVTDDGEPVGLRPQPGAGPLPLDGALL